MCGEMTKHCGLFLPLFCLQNALILSDETFFIRIFCPPPVTFRPSRLYWRVKGGAPHDDATVLVYKFTRLLVYSSTRLRVNA